MSYSWFVPSWNGDFRLEPDGEKACTLVVHEPTPGEIDKLGKFLAKAKKSGWTDDDAVPTGKKGKVALSVGVNEAGLILVQVVNGTRPTSVTGVKYADGKLEVVQTIDTPALAEAVSEEKKDDTKAAATTKRATPCCPSCEPGAIAPANEVLQAFLTPDQHRDWARHRVIEVEGGRSGHRYLIAHRNSKDAQRWTRHTFDADDQGVMHFYDWSVPPEEEVLGAALVLGSRFEGWLRNEATCLGGTPRGWHQRYKNPFGGFGDGTETSSFFSVLGQSLSTLLNTGKLPRRAGLGDWSDMNGFAVVPVPMIGTPYDGPLTG